MFTERILHKHPALIHAFTGIRAEEFWAMLEKMNTKLPAHEVERHTRDGRKRAIGAGRKFDQPLALRTIAVLSCLRLHVPQLVIALLIGLTQCAISRDLRRLLPLIQAVLPCPEVWDIVKATEPSEQLADEQVLVDATEQRVFRCPYQDETLVVQWHPPVHVHQPVVRMAVLPVPSALQYLSRRPILLDRVKQLE